MVNKLWSSSKLQLSDIPLLWKFVLLIEIVIWVPLVFIGFDAHHDGLILATVNLTKDAIQTGQPWPFNQYGPAWVLIYLIFAWPLPSEWVFLALRLVTVLSYFVTAFLVWKIAARFASNKVAFGSMILFLLTQPFVSNLGSDLVPWPSAIIMPFFAAVTLFSIQLLDSLKISSTNTRLSFLIGFFLTVILFSRAQIGLALLFVEIVLCFVLGKRYLRLLMIGVMTGTTLLFVFLSHHGFLLDSLRDEFVFGASYLTGDRSTYPLPDATFIGVSLAVLTLFLSNKLFRVSSKFLRLPIQGTLAVFLLAIFGLVFTATELISKYGLLDLTTLVMRRIWIVSFLAFIIYSLVHTIIDIYLEFKTTRSVKSSIGPRNYLVLVSAAAQFQVFPLFDQMHFWWGSVPAVVLVCIVVREKLSVLSSVISFSQVRFFSKVFLPICLSLTLALWMHQIFQTRAGYVEKIAQGIQIEGEIAAQEIELQQFFSTSILLEDKVLNLCENANVFFIKGSSRPAARYFLLWSNILDDSSMMKEIYSSKPNKVVTCSMNRVPAFQEGLENAQNGIINRVFSNPSLVAEYQQSSDLIWRIYREKNR